MEGIYSKGLQGLKSKIFIPGLIVLLILQTFSPMGVSFVNAAQEEISNETYLDKIDFGETGSENAHQLSTEFTSVITGLFDEKARVSKPRNPLTWHGGDLTFTMKVDPTLQNYVTVKFSGEDVGTHTMIQVNGEQVGYLTYGDYESINKGYMQKDHQFLYGTVMLPLGFTQGKNELEITIRSLNAWGNYTETSRGYYSAYTHTQAYIDVSDEKQGYKMKEDQSADEMLAERLSDDEREARIEQYHQGLIDRFNHLYNYSKNDAHPKLSIRRYVDDLMFFAYGLTYDQFPLQTPEEKREGLDMLFTSIDNHVKDYYHNTRLVLRGDHQGDWGGFYGALGEALYIVENLIFDEDILGNDEFQAFLDEPFETGSEEGEFSLASAGWDGEELTRRGAWERTLKANFDFARSRLSYISNQVYYTYIGAWEAHEGLRMIDSDFYEGKERSNRILLEALGVEPFLGEEVLVGPNDEELDVYHSLFHHDGQAHFTDDYIHIIGKGLAKSKVDEDGNVIRRKPYGEHHLSFTEEGMGRENGYVANYGEAVNYIINYFYKTLGHEGDEEANDALLKKALKSIHARGSTRLSFVNADGKRTMVAEAVTDERNQGLIGFESYGARIGNGMTIQHAGLEMHMVENKEQYQGEEWEPYWEYARKAVGFAQQQDFDHHLIEKSDFGSQQTMSGTDYRLKETYEYITETRQNYFDGQQMAGAVLPLTDFDYYTTEELEKLDVDPADYEQYGWADLDNLYVSIKDGDFRMLGSLHFKNRGVASNGRLHVINDTHEHIVQIAANNQFQYEDYFIRTHNTDWDFQNNREGLVADSKQALVGEMLPISYQPGIGTVNRDNFEADTPYSGYPELSTARYGKYFIIMNTTREEYGNKRTVNVDLPTDFRGSEALDLISGEMVQISGGTVTVPAKTAMVLKLSSDVEGAKKPNHVDFVHALQGNKYVGISWKAASGADSYTIKRATSADGSYEVIASNLTDTYYEDTEIETGKTYYYKVAAVNGQGEGWESWQQKVEVTESVSDMTTQLWRDDHIGTKAGHATIDDEVITITDVDGTGLDIEGKEDHNIYKRDMNDSLHFVNDVAAGNYTISTKIEESDGNTSGIMLRDRHTPDLARYVYLGADEDGKLVLQTRIRNSIIEWSGKVISPYTADIGDYTVEEYPFIKLVRDHHEQTAQAYVSKNGEEWEFVAEVHVLLPYNYLAGVTTAKHAVFSHTEVEEVERDTITPYITQKDDQVNLYWNKPRNSVSFNVYRTYEGEDLEDPTVWEKVLKETKSTSFTERNLRVGEVHFKVEPVMQDSTVGEMSDIVSASAESLESLIERLEAIDGEQYTQLSYYLFTKELTKLKEIIEHDDYDAELVANDLYELPTILEGKKLSTVYSFEENIESHSGEYNGETEGDPSYIDGQSGKAISLNGENQYVTIPSNPILSDAEEVTFAMWLNWQGGSNWQRVFDFGNNTNQYAFLSPSSGNNTLRFAIKNGGGEQFVEVPHKLPENEWVHVAVTLGNGVATMYLNGEKEAVNNEVTITPNHFKPNDNYIGKSMFDADPLFNGAIDEFVLVNQALSADEVKALFESNGIQLDSSLFDFLINEAEQLQPVLYTEESFEAVSAALDKAHELEEETETVTQEQLDQVTEELLTAIEQLEFVGDVPLLAPIGDRGVVAEQTITFDLHLLNGSSENVTLSATDLPEGAKLTDHTFTWTPTKGQAGTHAITFKVSDGEKETSREMKVIVYGEPTISLGTDGVFEAGSKVEFTVEGKDAHHREVILAADTLPENASFASETGVFIWDTTNVDVGSHTLTFYASNENFTVSEELELQIEISSAQYTKGSYYQFEQAFAEILEEIDRTGLDRYAFTEEIEAAIGFLTEVPDDLYEDIEVTEEMVIASTPAWGGGGSAEQNGWFAFDGNLSTATDTTENPSWIDVDFGVDNKQVINQIGFYPRSSHIDRINGAVIQVSNDQENWQDILTIQGVNQAKWHYETVADTERYQYVRYFAEEGNGNVAELAFATLLPDKTLLALHLQEVEKVDEDRYTEESFARLMDVYSDAQAINEADGVTQVEVDHVAEQLLAALHDLEKIYDRKTLESAISEAESYLDQATIGDAPTHYPESAKKELEQAIAEAKQALKQEDSTENQLKEAVLALEVALHTFKYSINQPFDKSELRGAIEQAQITVKQATVGQEAGQYPESAVTALEAEIVRAREVFDDFFATEKEIEDAVKALEEAVATLHAQIVTIDTVALEEIIDQATEALEKIEIGEEPGQYPQSAVDRLQAYISIAQEKLADGFATQEEVDDAIAELTQALAVFNNSENPEVDKKQLHEQIKRAQGFINKAEVGMKPGQYPEYAVEDLKEAIEKAQAIFNDQLSTNEEVQIATNKLKAAIADFEASKIVELDLDYTGLLLTLHAAKTALDQAEIGDKPGQYSEKAAKQLQQAIDVAEGFLQDPQQITQKLIDGITENLQFAINVFNQSANPLDDNELLVSLNEEVEVQAGQLIIIEGLKTTVQLPEDISAGTRLIITKAEQLPTDLVLAGEALTFTFISSEGNATDKADSMTLSMGYNSHLFAENEIGLYQFNEETDEWTKVTFELVDGLVTASVPTESATFGIFALSDDETPDPGDEDADDQGDDTPNPDPGNGDSDDQDDDTPNPDQDNDGSDHQGDGDPAGDGNEDSDPSTVDNTDQNGTSDQTDKDQQTELPKTATPMYNLLLVGMLLVLFGIGIALRKKVKRG